ncbi:MAG: hypothetical protein AB3N11_02825 [Arenibacterium sp.]
MFKRLLATALVFGAAALAPPASAQTAQCMPRDTLIETLQTKFGESLTGGGLQSENQLLELWSSQNTGSFTVLLTQPNGISCVVASGQNWNSNVIQVDKGLAS